MKAVLGLVLARCPRSSGGHTCATMNWALPLRELGWDVWIAEHLSSDELDPPAPGETASPQELHWHAIAAEFGFAGRQCLIIDGKSPDLEAFREFAAGADLFLNYSGQFKRLDLLGPRTRKCYLDVDPGFTQLWADVCGSDMNFDGHDVFLTVGSTLDRPGVVLPPLHREWIPVLHPVAAGYWRERAGGVTVPPPGSAWTTVSHWYGYSDLEWEGRRYGGKRASLLALRGLPRAAGVRLSIASDLEPAWGDYDKFIEDGWTLLKSRDVCRDVDAYLAFLAGSRGELGVAKEGYIVSRGGWISDRSVTYLALGRPVLLQDTGWTAAVSPRPGFLPFRDTADAAARIREVEEDYAAHSAGALAAADGLFSGAEVFGPLFSRIL